MDVIDILNNSENLPIVGIWLSGYLLLYSIFKNSQNWKLWDGTIKFIYALICGTCIEIFISIPYYFYKNIPNINYDLNVILNNTYGICLLISILSAFIMTYIIKGHALKRLLLKIFSYSRIIYFIVYIYSGVFIFEISKYYDNKIINAKPFLFDIIMFNFIISLFGLALSSYFQTIIDDLHLEDFKYERYLIKNRIYINRIKRRIFIIRANIFGNNPLIHKYKYLILLIIFIIPLIIMPLDSRFHFITPNITVNKGDVYEPDVKYFLIINSTDHYNYRIPETEYVVNNKEVDVYEIISPKTDLLNAFYMPISNKRNIIDFYYLGAIDSDYNKIAIDIHDELRKHVELNIVNEGNKHIIVNYDELRGKKFSLSTIYWKEIKTELITLNPYEYQTQSYNDTHFKYIQNYQIINNLDRSLFINNIYYYELYETNVCYSTVKVFVNGSEINGVYSKNNFIKFKQVEIKPSEEVNIEINFLRTK